MRVPVASVVMQWLVGVWGLAYRSSCSGVVLISDLIALPVPAICPMSLVWLELLQLMKGRSGVALTQLGS